LNHLLPESLFVILAAEFPRGFAEALDLGLLVRGTGFAGWHGDSLRILWTV